MFGPFVGHHLRNLVGLLGHLFDRVKSQKRVFFCRHRSRRSFWPQSDGGFSEPFLIRGRRGDLAYRGRRRRCGCCCCRGRCLGTVCDEVRGTLLSDKKERRRNYRLFGSGVGGPITLNHGSVCQPLKSCIFLPRGQKNF